MQPALDVAVIQTYAETSLLDQVMHETEKKMTVVKAKESAWYEAHDPGVETKRSRECCWCGDGACTIGPMVRR